MSGRGILVAVLVIVSGACGAAVSPLCAQDLRGLSDQQILTRIEHEWDAAFLRNDVGYVASVLADDFVATYDDGSTGDKERELKLVAEFNQAIESSKLDNFNIRIYGDTAVVAFTRHLAGPSQGRRLEVSFRYIDVFVLREGRWLCVASQSTKIAPKPAPPPQ
jgi:ketosteroid isomerase-like protein